MVPSTLQDFPLVFLPDELRRVIAAARADLPEGARVWLVGPPSRVPGQQSPRHVLADATALGDPDGGWSPIGDALAELDRALRPAGGAAEDPAAVLGVGSAEEADAIWERPLAGVSAECLALIGLAIDAASSSPRPRHHFDDLGELAWWAQEHCDGFEVEDPPLARGEQPRVRPWGRWRDRYLRVGTGPQHDGETAPDRLRHEGDDPDRGIWLLGADLSAFDLVREQEGENEELELRVARTLVRLTAERDWTGQFAYFFTASSEALGFDRHGRTLHGDPVPDRFVGEWILDEARALIAAHDARRICPRRLTEIDAEGVSED